jgi:hypothetical protein
MRFWYNIPIVQYKYTQIGYLMIFVALVLLVFFVWIYITASAESPSWDAGTNFAIPAVMVITLLILGSFSTLTVSIDEDFLRIKFGYGIFKKKFQLNQVNKVKVVRNPWFIGWGIRVWFWPYMWIYNVSGYDAVEIVLRNGRRYRIGTDKPIELERVIQQNSDKNSI